MKAIANALKAARPRDIGWSGTPGCTLEYPIPRWKQTKENKKKTAKITRKYRVRADNFDGKVGLAMFETVEL
jgi:hypothetical protein